MSWLLKRKISAQSKKVNRLSSDLRRAIDKYNVMVNELNNLQNPNYLKLDYEESEKSVSNSKDKSKKNVDAGNEVLEL